MWQGRDREVDFVGTEQLGVFLDLRLWDVSYNSAFKLTLILNTLNLIIKPIELASCRFDLTSEMSQQGSK